MASTISPDVARAAIGLRRTHPTVPAIEVLDVVMRGRAGSLADFGDGNLEPNTPFGQVLAAALDRGMAPTDWALVDAITTPPAVVMALRGVWRDQVLAGFAARYGLRG